jgi:hypothetical protein
MNRISRLLPLLAAPLLYGAAANQPPGLLSDPRGYQRRFPRV